MRDKTGRSRKLRVPQMAVEIGVSVVTSVFRLVNCCSDNQRFDTPGAHTSTGRQYPTWTSRRDASGRPSHSLQPADSPPQRPIRCRKTGLDASHTSTRMFPGMGRRWGWWFLVELRGGTVSRVSPAEARSVGTRMIVPGFSADAYGERFPRSPHHGTPSGPRPLAGSAAEARREFRSVGIEARQG